MPYNQNKPKLTDPTRMTQAWISKRTLEELLEFAEIYPYDTCRGISLREEIRNRRNQKETYEK